MVTVIMYLVLVVAPAVAFLEKHCGDESAAVAAVTRSRKPEELDRSHEFFIFFHQKPWALILTAI